jgi:hypothetical protein
MEAAFCALTTYLVIPDGNDPRTAGVRSLCAVNAFAERQEEKSWRISPICLRQSQKGAAVGSKEHSNGLISGMARGRKWRGNMGRGACGRNQSGRPPRGDAINIVHCCRTAADYDDFFGPQHTPDAHYVLSATRLISSLPIARFIAGGISFWAFDKLALFAPLLNEKRRPEREKRESFRACIVCLSNYCFICCCNAYKMIYTSALDIASLFGIGMFSALCGKQIVNHIWICWPWKSVSVQEVPTYDYFLQFQ